jgi:hypothetical protein
MILGMSISSFTLLHVILSLVGIVAGVIVVFCMLGSKSLDGWTTLFLATTVLTSVTGFFFPRDKILPSHIVGILSLVVLAIAIFALYARRLAGLWRATYVIAAIVSLYLNVFVLVAQSFQKLPLLNSLAPTQSEPPFITAQAIVLLIFGVLTVLGLRSFHPENDAAGLRAA